jgi:hypothetical protein
MERIKNRPSLPGLELFKQQFRQKFGREMTGEEVRFWTLTEQLLLEPPEEEATGKKSDVA